VIQRANILPSINWYNQTLIVSYVSRLSRELELVSGRHRRRDCDLSKHTTTTTYFEIRLGGGNLRFRRLIEHHRPRKSGSRETRFIIRSHDASTPTIRPDVADRNTFIISIITPRDRPWRRVRDLIADRTALTIATDDSDAQDPNFSPNCTSPSRSVSHRVYRTMV
jgi:hypothetical protein